MEKIKIYAFADEADPQIDGQIAAMQRNGLSGLEVRGVDGTNVFAISVEKAKEVKKKLDDAGLSVWSIGSPLGKIHIENDDFTEHMERFRHTVELAHIFGARTMRMFSFFMPENCDPARYHNQVIDRLGVFLEHADGIILCHENEKGIYGDVASRCLQIHQALPELKAVFDPANFVQCGQDTLQAWDMLKGYVEYMHIKDALPDGSVVPAGCGSGNVKQIATDYIRRGGHAFTMEPHLAVFAGLSDLEREGEESVVGTRYVYESNEAAFDAACNAFKKLLEEVAL